MRSAPSISHVFNLLEPTPKSGFLRGQLLIEGILVAVLNDRLDRPEAVNLDRLSYSHICSLCAALGLIDDQLLTLLRSIGSIRNKMAHQLDYELSFDDAFAMVKRAHAAGVDFSDDTIHSDYHQSSVSYGIEGIVQELFQNLAQDLVYDFDPGMEGVFSEFYSP